MGTYIYSSDHDFEMKKNKILPIFWNFFKDIEKRETENELKKVKKELKQLVEIVSNQVAIHQLQYFIQTSKNEKIKDIFKNRIKELSLPRKMPAQSFDPRFENMIENKIEYYGNTFFSIPFRSIHHTIITLTNFLKPLKIQIDLLSFYKFLFNDINFEKISDRISKEDIFKIDECKLTIKEGLEMFRKIYTNLARFKETVANSLNNFQLNINNLSQGEIIETRNQLVSILGSLKLQAKQNKSGIDFYARYEELDRQFKTQLRLHDEHYQMLVASFNEVMMNDLIGSFEIIIKSLNEITPVKTEEVSKSNQSKEQRENSRTKDLIKQELEKIDVHGWKYSFMSEEDYNIFLDLLTDYFEHRNYDLSITKIRLCKSSKTRFAKALRPIHTKLSGNSLKSELNFFEVIRVIDQFKELSNDEIYKAITR